MTPREMGFLLLTSYLGNPERCPLTTAQLRTLSKRVAAVDRERRQGELEERDLLNLGFGRDMARRILALLNDRELLEIYLRRGARSGCTPVTRVSRDYPVSVRNRLGLDAPGCLWARGDLSLLSLPGVSLVGSRDIRPENLVFAREVGRQAARQGFVLVSGNARGADQAAQESCLAAGGQVISVVADELERHPLRENVLFLSEDGFDLPFSSHRALSRNRLIHCMGLRTFVAQCAHRRGGTWDGTVKNLRSGWSLVYCFADGSPAVCELQEQGAELIGIDDLHNISSLTTRFFDIFDQ